MSLVPSSKSKQKRTELREAGRKVGCGSVVAAAKSAPGPAFHCTKTMYCPKVQRRHERTDAKGFISAHIDHDLSLVKCWEFED